MVEPAIPIVPFPVGLPLRSGGCGLYRNQPGQLPVDLLFRDWDLLWVQDGSVQVRYPGGLALLLRPGDLAILPPLTPVQVDAHTPRIAFHYCHLDVTDPTQLDPSDPHHGYLAGPGAGLGLPVLWRRSRLHAAVPHLRRITAGAGLEVHRGMLDLFATLAAGCRPLPVDGASLRPAPLDIRVERTMRRIDTDPAWRFSVAGLATAVGVSSGHLHALFVRCLGHGPKRYILEARLLLALRLLRGNPDAPLPTVELVARTAGFTSQAHLSRCFRARFGLPPGRYRAALIA